MVVQHGKLQFFFDIVFTYIDKGANWKNQCPKEEEDEPEPIIEDAPADEPQNKS